MVISNIMLHKQGNLFRKFFQFFVSQFLETLILGTFWDISRLNLDLSEKKHLLYLLHNMLQFLAGKEHNITSYSKRPAARLTALFVTTLLYL
jgi:hypothetical protein